MKPENFRLKMSLKIRRNWHGVKINDSEKLDKNIMILNLKADMNKWHSFEALRSAIKLSVEAVIEDRQVISKIHKKGFVINEGSDEEKAILPVLFINQEDD